MKGDKQSNGLIEKSVMPLRGIIRTIKCHIDSSTQEALRDDSPILRWLVEHAGCILSRCQKGRDGETPCERLHGKKLSQEFVRSAKQIRYKSRTWLGKMQTVYSVKSEVWNRRWDKEAANSVIGVPWRLSDGRWAQFQAHHCHLKEHEFRWIESQRRFRRVRSHCGMPSLQRHQGQQRGKPIQIVVEYELKKIGIEGVR